MKFKHLLSLVAFLIMGSSASLLAQVTTATIYGTIIDGTGNAVSAATVVATHEPSGTQYGTTTQDNGRFNLPNLRIGGPYTVTASFIGYSNAEAKDLSLTLGQKEKINLTLQETATNIDEVVVTADKNSLINKDKTGASTNVNSVQLRSLPTISRNTSDFYRLNPAAAGNSFLGRNDQFNNFSLDGSIYNNPFGLDAATPGGQTDASPVPLDAIEQVQVNLSPFDITQAGFTGASINTVTKSGTNEFHGTAFYSFRNDGMTGSKINGNDIVVPELSQMNTGIAIGGPIIKNKLFFHAAFELQRRDDAGSSFRAAAPGRSGEDISRVEESDLQMVSSLLQSKFGYNTGAYEGFLHATDNQKGIIKLDYAINQNHTLTFKYNWLDASKDKPAHPTAIGRRGPDFTTLQFENSGYTINNKINSGILELKSLFGNKISNKLQIGITAFRDSRDPLSTPFPVLNISRDGSRYIVAGHEPFSIHNVLDQDVLQFSDNLNFYMGDHTITAGVSFEKFEFNNSFNLGAYGGLVFAPDVDINNFEAFLDDPAVGFAGLVAGAQTTFDTNNKDGNWALAETNIGQFAVYLQDEWAASDKLTLTLGLRIDKPMYFDTDEKIQENIDRNCCYDGSIEYFEDGELVTYDHTVLPDAKPLISPRFGFNYDVKGDQSMQLRGGTGLFTGRFPFVWVGNHVANPNFFFYNYTDPDFNMPQNWKTNLGYDQKFENGFEATVDLIYQKDLNSMYVQNRGLNAPTSSFPGVDNRPVYSANDKNPFGNNAYVFTNSEKGYQFNGSIQLRKVWGNDFFTGLSYNYTESKDVSSIEAEISSDAYDNNPVLGNVNDDVLAHSIYGNRHRIVGNIYKKLSYGDGKFATTFAAFFEYAEGGRFSYTYSGDLNGDASGLNDLIYVPTESELAQMNFVSEEARAAFGNFIAQDEYLSGRRGEYAEKYGILSPWFSTFDLRILQDFNFGAEGNKNTVQLSIDILNFGNLLNSNWGVRDVPTSTQPISVDTANLGADGAPTYDFDTSLTKSFTADPSLFSRWQMQIGLRYIF